MAVAGLLAQYMAVKNQLSYCQLQDTRWNDLATAMSKKLSQQENYQSKWDDSSAAFYDSWDDTKEFKAMVQYSKTVVVVDTNIQEN